MSASLQGHFNYNIVIITPYCSTSATFSIRVRVGDSSSKCYIQWANYSASTIKSGCVIAWKAYR